MISQTKIKFLLYKVLVAHYFNGSSSLPITQYKNNPIYQEMTEEDEFTTNTMDDRIHVDIRRSKN